MRMSSHRKGIPSGQPAPLKSRGFERAARPILRAIFRTVFRPALAPGFFALAAITLFLTPPMAAARGGRQGQDQGVEKVPQVLREAPPSQDPNAAPEALPKLKGTLRIAAAADLQPVLPAIAEQFEKATGGHVLISYASSSTLATQIIQGGPFDLFLSADFTFPELVVARGFADSMQPTAYAQGTLALWARKDSPLQPISMEKLSSPTLKKLAIADQAHAPYGRAAYSALAKIKLLAALGPRLVIAENVAQAAQFAESGNADAAMISLTLAMSPHFKESGSYVLVPQFDYPAIRQCGVVMKHSRNREAAHAFLRFLVSAGVQKQLAKQGLGPPQ